MNNRPPALDRHRPALEAALKRAVGSSKSPLYAMLRYQLGWNDHHGMPVLHAPGDRTHGVLLLLAVEAAGGNATPAVPVAAGVELAHAFAQVHQALRHGDPGMPERPALWWAFSSSQGINAGDGLYALARLSFMEAPTHGVHATTITQALGILDRACLGLTEAQDRQITIETGQDAAPDACADAIEQAGAALPGAAASIGALLGGMQADAVDRFATFGRHAGAAWHLRQELDAVGGATAFSANRLVEALDNRRSLPLLHALIHATGADAEHLAALRRRDNPITDDALSAVLPVLDRSGSRDFVVQRISQALRRAETALDDLRLPQASREELATFARYLAGQES